MEYLLLGRIESLARRDHASFDILCEANAVELKNAVDTANKEIATASTQGLRRALRAEEKEHEITPSPTDEFSWGRCATC